MKKASEKDMEELRKEMILEIKLACVVLVMAFIGLVVAINI